MDRRPREATDREGEQAVGHHREGDDEVVLVASREPDGVHELDEEFDQFVTDPRHVPVGDAREPLVPHPRDDREVRDEVDERADVPCELVGVAGEARHCQDGRLVGLVGLAGRCRIGTHRGRHRPWASPERSVGTGCGGTATVIGVVRAVAVGRVLLYTG